MALSGSRDFNLTLAQIINNVGKKLLLSKSKYEEIEFRNDCKENINLFIKELQSNNVFLWSIYWEAKTLSASSEITGSDGNIYTCILGHTSSSDNKPITGADWRKYWILRGSTGGVWVTATVYTSIGDFELGTDIIGIEKAFLRDLERDVPLELIGRDKYYSIINKGDEGTPSQLYFEPSLTPKCFLHRQPDTISPDWVIHLLKIKKLQDFDNWVDNSDFYTKSLNCIIWNCAYIMSFNYGTINTDKRREFKIEAKTSKQLLRKGNVEKEDETFCKGAY